MAAEPLRLLVVAALLALAFAQGDGPEHQGRGRGRGRGREPGFKVRVRRMGMLVPHTAQSRGRVGSWVAVRAQEEVTKMHKVFCSEADRWETHGPCLKFKIKADTDPAQRAEVEAAMKKVQEKVPVEEGQKQVRKPDQAWSCPAPCTALLGSCSALVASSSSAPRLFGLLRWMRCTNFGASVRRRRPPRLVTHSASCATTTSSTRRRGRNCERRRRLGARHAACRTGPAVQGEPVPAVQGESGPAFYGEPLCCS